MSSNLVDLLTKPEFLAERASQLLFGQPVKTGRALRGYLKVTLPDGYLGWADARFLSPMTAQEFARYAANLNSFVKASTAAVYNARSRRPTAPFFVYYGTRLFTKRAKEGYARVILPGARSFLIKRGNIVPIKRESVRTVTGKMLVAEATRFLGVPYLWGGVTTAGFDCSGLVQTVLARYGINIPRDTKDQIRVGEKVERECIKTGDLLFFKRHVGFAIGKGRIIHSSAGGGGVRINSLTPDKPDYREDLDRDFNQARRVLCCS
ncbi:MAG: C40 family peptidase [Candidatus Zixiibacteriota bacterium]|nr:MAG: C40 family peptidase [candidate division Zixibacteria bacterium]